MLDDVSSVTAKFRFQLFRVALFLGNVVFMATVQPIACRMPTTLTLLQLGFCLFWIVNDTMQLIKLFPVLFLVMSIIGGLSGASFTNFLYLANIQIISNKDGESEEASMDMGLTYYERELTINVLLMASDLGRLLAAVLTISLKYTFSPKLMTYYD